MELIYLLVGLGVGALVGFLVAHLRHANKPKIGLSPNEVEEKYVVKALYEQSQQRVRQLEETIEDKEIECIDLNKALAGQEQLVQNLNENLKNRERELLDTQKQLRLEFQHTANQLLEEKSRRFTQQNQENINALLNPLNEKIKHFEQKIEHFYIDENKQRATLGEQLRQLTELNQVMTQEAKNLTSALKGESKTQGNWGELILEKILESSGLTKGREYLTQSHFRNEDGRRRHPDLIIQLPNNKQIVVDSKVSLTAYERYCNAEENAEAKQRLKAHLNSVKQHVKDLSSKQYQQLPKLNSLDFVLMFVPIEPAFALAMQHEPNLFYDAFQQNIIIVSPTTLLATTRTIANIWQQEQQNQNAVEIARQAGLLYDKVVGFVDTLQQVGNRLKGAQDSFHDAFKKLHTGRNSVTERAEKLRKLGAKTSKSLPEELLPKEDKNID